MMTLPKLPSTSSQIPEANRFRKTASTDWLLQDAKTKFSQSSMSPSSSGASMDNSYPKMSTQSSSSNFSEVCQTNYITIFIYLPLSKEYFSPKKNSYQRSINAYYRHIERINLERTQSLSNLSKPPKSGKPSMLKPLKLWKPTQGKDKMMWVYGNPFSETDPKYLRTGSGQMTRLEEKTLGKLNF